MEQNIKFDKEKVWANIELDQNKKRRKRLLPFFTVALFALVILFIVTKHNTSTQSQLTQGSSVSNETTSTTSLEKNIKETTQHKSNQAHPEKENKEKVSLNPKLNSKKIDKAAINNTNKESQLSKTNKTIPSAQKKTVASYVRPIQFEINPKQLIEFYPIKKITFGDIRDQDKIINLSTKFITESKDIKKPLFRKASKSIFAQGSTIFSKFQDSNTLENSWTYAQGLNFISSNTFGIEWRLANNIIIRTGVNLELTSSTYDHTQYDIESGTIADDTISIYNNTIMTGSRLYTTEIERRIVSNNQLIRIGVPVALGYSIDRKSYKVNLLMQSTYSRFLKFTGVIANANQEHITDQDFIKDNYFTKKSSINMSGLVLLEKRINRHLTANTGLEFIISDKGLPIKTLTDRSFNGIGISIGLSYHL